MAMNKQQKAKAGMKPPMPKAKDYGKKCKQFLKGEK